MQSDKRKTEIAPHSACGQTKCCLNCHFLMKWDRPTQSDEIKMLIDRDARLHLGQGEPPERVLGANYSLACFKNVWDSANLRKDSKKDLVRILTDDRGESCFFYPDKPGMFFPAGEELEKREADRREAKRDRNITKWGIVWSIVCVVLGTILGKFLGGGK